MPTAIPRPQCSLCVRFRTRYLTNSFYSSSWSGARQLQVEKPVNLIVKGLPAVRREQLANQSWKLVGDFVLHKVVRDESPPELYLVALDPVQADVFRVEMHTALLYSWSLYTLFRRKCSYRDNCISNFFGLSHSTTITEPTQRLAAMLLVSVPRDFFTTPALTAHWAIPIDLRTGASGCTIIDRLRVAGGPGGGGQDTQLALSSVHYTANTEPLLPLKSAQGVCADVWIFTIGVERGRISIRAPPWSSYPAYVTTQVGVVDPSMLAYRLDSLEARDQTPLLATRTDVRAALLPDLFSCCSGASL
ncbi:hypothetical protein SCP_0200770 [Sparassis crispa]|uniref:Uncharacterized protein n=1 Tax=Sparassis crispa TaxID=139825 RepID=A0A401G9N5_9APHY|nr:hypothetical protein SCP_0200770 [Sparassis crispa]GBE78880.1 hypothetical protein SCP_0200770 [Sparassis crispa]